METANVAMKIVFDTRTNKLDYHLPERADPDYIRDITLKACQTVQQGSMGNTEIPHGFTELIIVKICDNGDVKSNTSDKHTIMGLIAQVAYNILCSDKIKMQEETQMMEALINEF